jgi:glycosyltransferase involved in cell wall biosynthesis
LRILYFTRDYTPHDHRFLAALAKTKHQVFYLRLERGPRQIEDRPVPVEIEQVAWQGGHRPFQWRSLPRLLVDLRRVLARFQPDLIHAGPIQSAAFMAAMTGFRPLVSMSWGSDLLRDADSSSWMRWVTRYTLARTTLLLGDCQAVRHKAVSLGFPSERVALFPWGIDLQQFLPARADDFRQRLGWQDCFVLLSLRSWEPLYGVDGLVRAFCQAARQIPDLRLLLLGGGSQAANLRQILLQNEMLDRVYFGGQVNQADLPGYYRASDLYLSASHSDGSSVSLMEALACGKPVLVSDIPGNQEWITPGTQGWLFQDGDINALAGGIITAFDQRQQLAGMGQAARALAEQRADWTRNFKILLDAYEMALVINCKL